MAVARATMLAVRMWRNKGADRREMLEKHQKLETQGQREGKVMSGYSVLEVGDGAGMKVVIMRSLMSSLQPW